MASTAFRVSKAFILNVENGAHVGMCLFKVRLKRGINRPGIDFLSNLKMGKKSTKLAAGDPDSTVKVPARSAMERRFRRVPKKKGQNDRPKRTNKSSTESMS